MKLPLIGGEQDNEKILNLLQKYICKKHKSHQSQ